MQRGINGNTVARVDARALDMLHNAGNQHVFTVAERVSLNLQPA